LSLPAASDPRRRALCLRLAALLAAGGCTGRDDQRAAGPRTVRLWVAPNPAEERFWTIAVNRWNSAGLGAPVEFTTIPATGGSEEAVLTALVSGSGPDLCTNIFPGFAGQLANLGQLQDISAMPNFERIKAQRQMGGILDAARVAGRQAIMPMYQAPMLIWWRADLLKAHGLREPPQTFEEVYRLSESRAKKDGGLGMQVLAGREWRSRWFDYIAYYFACSDGAPFIQDRRAHYDSPAGLAVLAFIQTMFRQRWTAVSTESDDPLPTGLVAGAARGAWDISAYARSHPQTLKQIVIGPMPRDAAGLKAGQRNHTFADAKGMVLFKSSQMQAEALAFMAWVFGDDDLSLLWFKETGMPPARGDLMSNPRFADFYRGNPMAATYAAYVDVASPSVDLEETIDVNKIISQMIDTTVFEQTPVPQAAREAVRQTNAMLERSR
jgi:multiple sugar transport system substrate-binding protein